MKDFIEETSRGSSSVPHVSTFQLVVAGLCYVKQARNRVCCRDRLRRKLLIIDNFYDYGLSTKKLMTKLANVLLSGLHNLENGLEKNSVLYQTSIKKARMAE